MGNVTACKAAVGLNLKHRAASHSYYYTLYNIHISISEASLPVAPPVYLGLIIR